MKIVDQSKSFETQSNVVDKVKNWLTSSTNTAQGSVHSPLNKLF